jgi:hypothetical protein
MVRVFLYLKKWEVPKSLLTNPVLHVFCKHHLLSTVEKLELEEAHNRTW